MPLHSKQGMTAQRWADKRTKGDCIPGWLSIRRAELHSTVQYSTLIVMAAAVLQSLPSRSAGLPTYHIYRADGTPILPSITNHSGFWLPYLSVFKSSEGSQPDVSISRVNQGEHVATEIKEEQHDVQNQVEQAPHQSPQILTQRHAEKGDSASERIIVGIFDGHERKTVLIEPPSLVPQIAVYDYTKTPLLWMAGVYALLKGNSSPHSTH